MKNQSPKQIMDVLYVNEPASRDFTQYFQYGEQLIIHRHQLEVSLMYHFEDLEVKNYYTVRNETQLRKVTEIILENRVIRMIDTFESMDNPNAGLQNRQISNQNEGEGRKPGYNQKYQSILRDPEGHFQATASKSTKNVAKNILRLFQSWLQEKLPRYRQTYEKTTSIVRNGKFNNSLVARLLKNNTARLAFENFLSNDAREYIARSKINDKRTHLEAMLKYLNIFETASTNRKGEKSECACRGGKLKIDTVERLPLVKQE